MSPKKGSGKKKPSENQGKFVPAVFARSVQEAEEYRELLDDHDIPAIVASEEDLEKLGEGVGEISRGVPVLVPEAMLDEAGEVIAEREEFEKFHVGDEDEYDEEEDEEEEEFGYDSGSETEFEDEFDEEKDEADEDDDDAENLFGDVNNLDEEDDVGDVDDEDL